MKNIILVCSLLILISNSKERPAKASAFKKEDSEIKKDTELTLNGKTYVYDNINWEKSSVKNEKDIRLSIWQEGLPQIKFRFPEVKRSLADGQGTFKIPDIHRRGFSPITLNFIVALRDKKRVAVSFRTGVVIVSFTKENFTMEFSGEGGPTLDDSTTYPISGTVNINM